MALTQRVFVHIWDGDNANVYGSRKAAIAGISSEQEYSELQLAALKEAIGEAVADPGEAIYIDGGMSIIRHLIINY